jgi:hypothetical protein
MTLLKFFISKNQASPMVNFIQKNIAEQNSSLGTKASMDNGQMFYLFENLPGNSDIYVERDIINK